MSYAYIEAQAAGSASWIVTRTEDTGVRELLGTVADFSGAQGLAEESTLQLKVPALVRQQMDAAGRGPAEWPRDLPYGYARRAWNHGR